VGWMTITRSTEKGLENFFEGGWSWSGRGSSKKTGVKQKNWCKAKEIRLKQENLREARQLV
jgi:hypothetical protein